MLDAWDICQTQDYGRDMVFGLYYSRKNRCQYGGFQPLRGWLVVVCLTSNNFASLHMYNPIRSLGFELGYKKENVTAVTFSLWMVPRTGLEPARLSTLAPETSASTIPPPGL